MKSHWFKNAKFDLLFLTSPYIMTCLVLLIPFHTESELASFWAIAPFYWWFVIDIVFDWAHVWSTLYRTVFDGDTMNTHNKGFWVSLPIISFIVIFIFGFISKEILLRFLFYSVYYHGVKQLYGIISLYRTRHKLNSGELSEAENLHFKKMAFWDRVMVNCCFFVPFFLWHFRAHPGLNIIFRLDQAYIRDFFLSPEYFAGVFGYSWNEIGALVLFLFVGLPTLRWSWLHFSKIVEIPIGKVIWVYANVITYIALFWFNSTHILAMDLLLVVHALPYMALIALYRYKMQEEETEEAPTIKSFIFSGWKSWGLVFVAAVFQVFLLDVVFLQVSIGAYFAPVSFLNMVQTSPWVRGTVCGLLFLPNVTHFLVDAYIWRFDGKNPHLFQYMFK
jgi:hypothetical protein